MNTILAILSKLKWLASLIDKIKGYFEARKQRKVDEAKSHYNDYKEKYGRE